MPTTPSWRADCHAVLTLAFFNIYRLVSAASRNTYNFQIHWQLQINQILYPNELWVLCNAFPIEINFRLLSFFSVLGHICFTIYTVHRTSINTVLNSTQNLKKKKKYRNAQTYISIKQNITIKCSISHKTQNL